MDKKRIIRFGPLLQQFFIDNELSANEAVIIMCHLITVLVDDEYPGRSSQKRNKKVSTEH